MQRLQLGLIIGPAGRFNRLLMSNGEIAYYEYGLYKPNEIVAFKLDCYDETNKLRVTILKCLKDIECIELSKQYSKYELNSYDYYDEEYCNLLAEVDVKLLKGYPYVILQGGYLYYDSDYYTDYDSFGEINELSFGERLLIRAKFTPPTVNDIKQALNEIITRVENTNIMKIINSFEINVSECFKCRPGKDDYYYIFKDYALKEEHDKYWNTLFPERMDTIYETHGYTDAYRMRTAKDEDLGRQYDEEDTYKKKAYEQYDSKEHIIFLLYEYIRDLLAQKECLITRESFWPIRKHLSGYYSDEYIFDNLYKEHTL